MSTGGDYELSDLTVAELKKVLSDYNRKLSAKKYKMSMKKLQVIQEIEKMYKWTHNSSKKKITFIRKGKQHSYVLNLKGGDKRAKEDRADEIRKGEKRVKREKKKKKERKQKIKKATIMKRVVGQSIRDRTAKKTRQKIYKESAKNPFL